LLRRSARSAVSSRFELRRLAIVLVTSAATRPTRFRHASAWP
jgi:hypothetical protein